MTQLIIVLYRAALKTRKLNYYFWGIPSLQSTFNIDTLPNVERSRKFLSDQYDYKILEPGQAGSRCQIHGWLIRAARRYCSIASHMTLAVDTNVKYAKNTRYDVRLTRANFTGLHCTKNCKWRWRERYPDMRLTSKQLCSHPRLSPHSVCLPAVYSFATHLSFIIFV